MRSLGLFLRGVCGFAGAGALITGLACQHSPRPLIGRGHARELPPQAFIKPQAAPVGTQAQLTNSPAGQQAAPTQLASTQMGPPQVAPQYLTADRTPVISGNPGPATGPAIGKSDGAYMILGGVVAEVDSSPVYANRVLTELDLPLRQKAKDLAPKQFQDFARQQISEEIVKLIHEELEYAAAQRGLEQDDMRIADMATQDWRKKQISAAGGSLEVARSKAARDGSDFDEIVQQQYRSNVVQIYYEKKIYPKIQVSAQDLRKYYERKKASEFSEREAARFRVIEISFEKTGGRDKALAKATEKLTRLQKGEEFAHMASVENDNAWLAANAGFPGKDPIERGHYAQQNVDDEVWKLQPGQITGIVEGKAAFYIARMEERRDGRVRPFEEQETQASIRNALERSQFTALREAHLMELEQRASVRTDEQMMNIALDMAMQKYQQWATK